jgi:hypothetical protein
MVIIIVAVACSRWRIRVDDDIGRRGYSTSWNRVKYVLHIVGIMQQEIEHLAMKIIGGGGTRAGRRVHNVVFLPLII